MGLLFMSEREMNRIEVLAQIDDGRLSVEAATGLLDVSRRQLFRLLRAYRTDGAAAIRHKARGRPPNNLIHPAKRDYVLALVRESYADFGPTLAVEKVAERDGVRIPRKLGTCSTRSWALIPRHLGQPFHAKVGSWFDRRFHGVRLGLTGQGLCCGRRLFACFLR